MNNLDAVFSLDFSGDDFQSSEGIDPRVMRMRSKADLKSAMRKEKAAEIIDGVPAVGESVHIVSNGSFDYWGFVPLMIEHLGAPVTRAYFSTWTLNRHCCKELFEMLDDGQIEQCGFLTGIYFKSRESAIYAQLVSGLQARGQKYKALENHSKLVLLECGKNYIVMEGSANFTANPRIEQNTIYNSKELFDFHAEWIEEVLSK